MSRSGSPARNAAYQSPDTNPEYELLLREAESTDLRDLERTNCVTTGEDPDGNLILLFIPRLGFEGTTIDFSSETQKMRKMLLLFIKIAEPLLKGDYTIVYGHSQFSILNQYNLLYGFYVKLPRKYKKNLKQMIIVFPNFSLRLALDFVRIFRIVKGKSFSKLVFVEDIVNMQKLVPPSSLALPPVFLHWEDMAKGLNHLKGNLPSLTAIFDPELGILS